MKISWFSVNVMAIIQRRHLVIEQLVVIVSKQEFLLTLNFLRPLRISLKSYKNPTWAFKTYLLSYKQFQLLQFLMNIALKEYAKFHVSPIETLPKRTICNLIPAMSELSLLIFVYDMRGLMQQNAVKGHCSGQYKRIGSNRVLTVW